MKELNLSENAPWRQRFRATSILWATLAKDNPARGLVCTNRDGIFQLYAWDVATGALRQASNQPAGVIGGLISADGQYIYYHRDQQGNEIGHYARVPFEGGEPQDVTPDMPPYASFFINQSKNGAVTGLTAAGAGGFQVFTWKEGAAPRLLYQSGRMTVGPFLSADGRTAVVSSTERTGTLDSSLLAFDVEGGEQLAELWDGEGSSINPGPFSPVVGDARMLATSSKSGYERPLIWNPRTGERADLALDSVPGEVTPGGWSPDGKRVLLVQLHQAEFQLYTYDLEQGTATKLNHPAGVVGSGFFTPEGDIYVTWQDPSHPPRLIALDGQTGEQKRVVLAAGEAPPGRSWRSFTFTGAYGEPVQGWVSTPEGDGPFPTILETHGGPTWVMSPYFAPGSQAWLDHGFAFCTINYHGSTTFGKAFEKSLWGNLGQAEVEDMAAAYHWLVDNGIAAADSVLLTGGSYGGYLTLQAIGKTPALWAGGMAQVAIADWRLMYEDQAETLRGYQRALFGGTPDETPEITVKASPITYAEQIQAPVLVIQGKNDTRCPARQMEAYEQKLKLLGKSIEIHWFDAGHGSRAQAEQIEHQELMMRFAYRVLG